MKYIIYLTKNLKSKVGELNKIYVGVHKTENPNIFDGYLGCGVYAQRPSSYMYPKTPIQYAIKKYGPQSFERTTLHIYDDEELAYKKEEEIVNLDFIKLDHTYNVSLGGMSPTNYEPLYQFDLEGNLIKYWEHSGEAYDFYGYPGSRFYPAINNKISFLECYWGRCDKIDINDYSNKIRGNPKRVYLYSKQGKMICEFESEKECAKYLGISGLFKSVKEEALIQGKYYVSDKMVDEFKPKPRKNIIDKTFYIYDVNNKFYGKFVGKEIMNVINLHSWVKICNALRCNRGWFKDFYVSEIELTEVPCKKSINSVRVDVHDKYGNFIETLNSVKEVREKYKVPSSKIRNIQEGNKYFGDYIFIYNSK